MKSDCETNPCFEGLRYAFQPIVDLETGRPVGVEALTRPGDGSPHPCITRLLESAHDAGDVWTLERVIRNAVLTIAADHPALRRVFVNCSPRVITDARFPEALAGECAAAGVDASRIVLEITERDHDGADTDFRERIAELKAIGARIAIDDVGAGASGLSRIMLLRPHWLKLDHGLIQGIESDRVRQNLVRFAVNFGQLSGIRVIAEGIEHDRELRALARLGVRFVQGYLLGRPGEADAGVDDAAATRCRAAWREGAELRSGDPRETPVAALSARPLLIESTRSLRDAAAELMTTTAPGALVIEGDRPLGWVNRDTLMALARSGRGGEAIGGSVPPNQPVLDPETGIAEAIEIAATREDRAAGWPLILHAAGEGPRVAPVPTLLAAAAELTQSTAIRSTPLTGLPGRLRTDKYIGSLLAVEGDAGPAHDAAFIDLRCLTAYIRVYGHSFGDEIVHHLAGLLQTCVVRGERDIFLAHLGGDRFFVLAPAGRLAGRIETLTRRFDETREAFTRWLREPDLPTPAGEECDTLALRALIAHDALPAANSPAAVHAVGAELRRRCARDHEQEPGASVRLEEDFAEVHRALCPLAA